jgi:exonuclease VII small subunit
MHMTETTTPTEMTFEAGYDRLKAIAERIDQDEVPVSELCDLFAEGKGLELALTGYLDTQRTRLQSIERGEGVQSFRIVASAAGDVNDAVHGGSGIDQLDFAPATRAHDD